MNHVVAILHVDVVAGIGEIDHVVAILWTTARMEESVPAEPWEGGTPEDEGFANE